MANANVVSGGIHGGKVVGVVEQIGIRASVYGAGNEPLDDVAQHSRISARIGKLGIVLGAQKADGGVGAGLAGGAVERINRVASVEI